jgi:hypothetical protein
MIPEHQTWQNDGDVVSLEKNHGSGESGYYVDVQGSKKLIGTLKKSLEGDDRVNCHENSAGLTGAGYTLTVREVNQNFQGNAILKLIGDELRKLGYSKAN